MIGKKPRHGETSVFSGLGWRGWYQVFPIFIAFSPHNSLCAQTQTRSKNVITKISPYIYIYIWPLSIVIITKLKYIWSIKQYWTCHRPKRSVSHFDVDFFSPSLRKTCRGFFFWGLFWQSGSLVPLHIKNSTESLWCVICKQSCTHALDMNVVFWELKKSRRRGYREVRR